MINQYPYINPTKDRQYYDCIVCNEVIFNPLCHNCLAEQLEVWLTQYPDLKEKLMPLIRHYVRKVENFAEEATQCVACYKKASVCPYCFTEFVLEMLNKLNADKRTKIEFLQFFNFDLKHEGYSKEAEKLGMY